MKSDGTVTYLSYFGGSGRSTVAALARGANGNLYVAGVTYSADFPTTAGAYDRTCGTDGGCNYGDPSVAELTPDGSMAMVSSPSSRRTAATSSSRRISADPLVMRSLRLRWTLPVASMSPARR